VTRRLLGPVGGPVAFALVAGLVFTGLGWVTVAALRVEDAQRESAARADAAKNLSLALWRLDGRLLPALGVENARTFQEYAPADPDSPYGPTCGPLLSSPLPAWMRLHVQLDAATGWDSPQVLSGDAAERFRVAWPELVLQNATPERARALDQLRVKHPFKAAFAAFAGGDLTPPTDAPRVVLALPPAIPSAAGARPAPAPAPAAAGVAAPDVFAPAPKAEPQRRAADNNAAEPVQAPPPRPAEPVARGNERDDAAARSRAASLAADGRQSSGYAYPNTAIPQNSNRFQQNFDGFQNGLALGRAAPPADRDNRASKADEKGASGPVAATLAAPPPGVGGGGFGANIKGAAGGDGKLGGTPPPTLGGLVEYFARGFREESKESEKLRMAERAKAAGDAVKNEGKTYQKEYRADATGARPESAGRGAPPRAAGGFGDRGGIFGGGVPGGGGFGGPGGAPAPGAVPAPPGGPAGPPVVMVGPKAADPRGGPPPAPAPAPAVAGLPLATGPAGAPVPVPPTPDPAPPAPLVPADAAAQQPVELAPPAVAVHLGPVRPQWLTAADGTDTLALVRTAKLDGRTVYQGVVLDWPRLCQILRADVADLFPDATLVPLKAAPAADGPPEGAMTTLPVRLEPNTPTAPPPAGWTPLRIGLALAWGAAVVAFAALGLVGWSLIDLSERRIRFVSAVTHELRTPLTSLRLYLDLLLSGMVQDEQKRTEYLSTLATESDRLHRLVDNVLDFARLERRRAGTALVPAKVADLLAAVRDTWTDRCGADGKELIVVSTLPPEAEVTTDAALVGQIVGNLIDNARKYTRGASDPRVWVWAKPEGRRVVFEVEDRGPGVAARDRSVIFRPFRRGEGADTTAGGAGLGLALCRQWAESLGGSLTYRPAEGGTGASFRLELPGK
jgi:signal transduction histidine kinase